MALALSTTEWNNNTEPASYTQTLLEQMKISHELAAQNIERCHKKNAALQADKYTKISFEVGQKVWLYWPPQLKPSQVKKFSNRWHGLYEILRKLSNINYKIKDLTGLRRKILQVVHVARLKAFVDADPPTEIADLWKEDSFDWRKEQDLQRLKLVVITKDVIPEAPITMDPMPLRKPAQPAEVVKGELPLPTEEDSSINLDQHEGEADDYAK